jgi:two-component system, response regulator YesN
MASSYYRFLLVDDEEIIRKGISENIDWEEEGFVFLPPCQDGLEAMESIRKNKPDVVLTDICMPGADGLDVARYIFENSPDTLTLILSGYDDFEYAQRAMSLRVMDFLLKPISSRTLKKHLLQIREALEQRDEREAARVHLLSLLDKSRRAVSDRFLSRLISGRVELPEAELLCEDLAFLSKKKYFSVICLEMDSIEEAEDGLSLSPDLLFLSMEEACDHTLADQEDAAKISTADNRIVIILGRNDENRMARECSRVANGITSAVQEKRRFTASAGIGKTVERVEDIYTSYRQAVTALQHRLIAGNNGVFLFSSAEYRELDMRLTLTKCCEDIRRDVRVGKNSDSVKTCREFSAALRNGKVHPKQARREIVKFVSVMLDVVEEVGIAQSQMGDKSFSEYLYDIMDVTSLADLDFLFQDFFDRVEQILREKRDSFPRKKLHDITRYIDIHFADPVLSAETVAEKFFISTGYLTKLFRQHLEKTFLEYIMEKKMARARELLKTSDLKNYEIAEQLGYKDPHYFSTSFKKYFGQTPSEYKSSL